MDAVANMADDSGSDGNRSGAAALDATLDAWRARGDQRLDPVRFCLIEAMARRASAHRGAARRVLDDRLAVLMAAYAQALADAPLAPPAAATPMPASAPPTARGAIAARQKEPAPRGPLGELVDHLARQSMPLADDGNLGTPASDAAIGTSAAPELKTLSYFRSTWSRLSADRRWTQSLATVPENAGPLNSHHLLHRSLTLMRALSPAYFNHFMSYADALLSIDQMNATGTGSASAEAPRSDGAKGATKPARKTTRRKSA